MTRLACALLLVLLTISVSASGPGGIGSPTLLHHFAASNATQFDDGGTFKASAVGDRVSGHQLVPESTGASPEVVSDGIGGLPALRFDGNDHNLILRTAAGAAANLSSDPSHGGIEVYAVLQPDAASSDRDKAMVLDYGRHSLRGLGFAYSAGYAYGYTSVALQPPAPVVSTHAYGAAPRIVSFELAFSGLAIVSVNGVPVNSNAAYLAEISADTITFHPDRVLNAGPVTVGMQSKTGGVDLDHGRSFDGLLAELLVFRDLLSGVEARRVRTALHIKYDVPLTDAFADWELSTGETVFTAANATGFTAAVHAIASDAASDGLQRADASDGVLTLAAASPAPLPDTGFAVMAHDGGSVADMGASSGALCRFPRTYRASANGAYTVELRVLTSALPAGYGTAKLLVAGDAALTTPTEHDMVDHTTYQAVNVSTASSPFYFTVGSATASLCP